MGDLGTQAPDKTSGTKHKRVSVYMIASDGNGGIIETDISKHLKDFQVVQKEGSVLLNASSLQIELPNSLIKQMSEI